MKYKVKFPCAQLRLGPNSAYYISAIAYTEDTLEDVTSVQTKLNGYVHVRLDNKTGWVAEKEIEEEFK